MSTSPVLALPNFTLPFVLETDASGAGIGAILMKQGRPIAFYSEALGPKALLNPHIIRKPWLSCNP
jgi:hypothetical protein